MRPSEVRPSSANCTCPRPCIESIASLRVSVHLTGRPRRTAARATAAWSVPMPALPPKAPPTCGATTRTSSLVQPEGVGEQVAGHVRVLRGDPGGDPGRRSPGSTRMALPSMGAVGDALVDHPGPDDVVGALERVGAVLVAAPGGDVGAETLELQGSVVGHRRLDVGDDRQVVVVDVDQLGRVDRLRAGLRDHEGDRVADEPDLVVGERPARALLVDVGERLQAAGPRGPGPCRRPARPGPARPRRCRSGRAWRARTGCARTRRARRPPPGGCRRRSRCPRAARGPRPGVPVSPAAIPACPQPSDRTGGSLRDGAPRRPESCRSPPLG